MSSAHDPRRDRLLLGAAGVTLLVTVLVASVREASPEWEHHQENVRRIVAERMGAEAAAKVPVGLRQTWIPEMNRVDRCVTCHVTIDWGPELATAPNPAKSHPRPELLRDHPIEKHGCTLCHGGQGYAVTEHAAHGKVAFWDEPVIDAAKAKRYGATVSDLLESQCNLCHRHQAEVAGMPLVNAAKTFFRQRKCQKCHTVDGEGGNQGPELTKEGDKHAVHYVFPAGWSKPRTALAWHLQHFLDPASVVPGSPMPKFVMEDSQRLGLALLVLSWRSLPLPAAWVPRSSPPPQPPK